MTLDWKANRNLLLTGIASAVCWLGFVLTITILQSQSIAFVFLLISILSLLRFGQLLDKRLEGVI